MNRSFTRTAGGGGGEGEEEEEEDELNRSLIELERRHDQLLLGDARQQTSSSSSTTSTNGTRSKVLLEYSGKLQAENDLLKRELAQFEVKQREWDEEKLVLEKKREKARRALHEELQQATLTMEQEIEKCGQIVRDLSAGLDQRVQDETRKYKQELFETKSSYEARIKALDGSLWEMKKKLNECEESRASDTKRFELELARAVEEERQIAQRTLDQARADWLAQHQQMEAESKAELDQLRLELNARLSSAEEESQALRREAEDLRQQVLARNQPQQQQEKKDIATPAAAEAIAGQRTGMAWIGLWMLLFALVVLVASHGGDHLSNPMTHFQQAGRSAWSDFILPLARSTWCKLVGMQLLAPPVS